MVHSNPLTLESMRDVHKQLCIFARQKAMSAQAAKSTSISKPAAAAQKTSTSPQVASSAPTPKVSAADTTSSTAPTAPATGGVAAGASGGSGTTTISLTGSGTNYSKADGPIDPSFKSKRQVA
ncbi:MAG: hypothetical protein ACJ706_07815, partial [Nitrososphaeraceae archaeon]